MVYLDNAASTPLLPEVIELMQQLMPVVFGNPSSIHSYGRESRVLLEESRKKIAALLHVAPSEIIFTSGGTEANNLALKGCTEAHGIQHIITTHTEHPAVLRPVEALAAEKGLSITYLDTDAKGCIAPGQLEEVLKQIPAPALVSLMHANNETGALLPLKDVSELCTAYGAFFHSDMVQTFGKFALDFSKIKVDFASCSAHKFHGPKGVGFLYVRSGSSIKPAITGGSQERSMRAGTENIWNIAGMAKALEAAYAGMEHAMEHIASLKAYTAAQLAQIEGVTFNAASDKGGLHTILSVSFPRTMQTEMLVYRLDMEGIAVSGGSACASGSVHPSHVLEAMGLGNERVSLRISFSKFNTQEEIERFIQVLNEILKP